VALRFTSDAELSGLAARHQREANADIKEGNPKLAAR
jgi:hypothetical protein